MDPKRDAEQARAELDRALDIVFVRWGEWHLVEGSPFEVVREAARLQVAKAEEAVMLAQRRVAEAESRLQPPRK